MPDKVATKQYPKQLGDIICAVYLPHLILEHNQCRFSALYCVFYLQGVRGVLGREGGGDGGGVEGEEEGGERLG